jgi:hypothetical protein
MGNRQLLICGSYQTLVFVQGLASDSPDASTAASSVRAPRGYVPRRHASFFHLIAPMELNSISCI